MVIAIDGPAGSGKSTIAGMLASRLGFTYINSGNLYRAITFACLKAGITPTNSEKVIEFAEKIPIDYRGERVFLDGEDITDGLHTDEIDRWASPLSAIVPVRHIVNGLIRAIAGSCDAVVEGRDMTSVVFPHAEHRFYLDASIEARSQRRFSQGVSQLGLDEIREAIAKRDEIDKNKEEGSLIIAPGTEYLDTSDLTLIQVYEILEKTIKRGTRTEYDGSGIAST